jgi:parallel beta-helix repeat protein
MPYVNPPDWVNSTTPALNATNLDIISENQRDHQARLLAVESGGQSGLIDVRSFGAQMNGTADDTTPITIRNAIAAAKAQGTGIVLAGGGTALTGELFVDTTMTIRIERGTTLKLKAGANTALLVISDTGTTFATGTIVEGGGTIDGNKAAQTGGTGQAVYIDADRVKVRGMRILNARFSCINMGGSNYCQIVDNEIEGAGSDAVFLSKDPDPCSFNLIARNVIKNSGGNGIKVVGDAATSRIMRGNRIIENHVEDAGQTFISIEVWNQCPESVITNNVTRGSAMGVSVDQSNGTVVANNSIFSPATAGVEIATSHNCAITGNTVDGEGETLYAIVASNTPPQKNTITGNTVKNTVESGIYSSFSEEGVISSNTVENPGIYGIRMAGTKRAAVIGNVVRGGTNAFMFDAAQRILFAENYAMNSTVALRFHAGSGLSTDRIKVLNNMFEGHTTLRILEGLGTHTNHRYFFNDPTTLDEV